MTADNVLIRRPYLMAAPVVTIGLAPGTFGESSVEVAPDLTIIPAEAAHGTAAPETCPWERGFLRSGSSRRLFRSLVARIL